MDNARVQFVEEGVRSYLDAVTAVIAFQNAIQERCRRVLDARIEEYASALTLSLTSADIKSAAWPSFDKWDGSYWCLGAQIVRKDIPGVRWWETYCCLQLNASDGLWCWVGEWLPNQQLASDMHSRLARINPKAQHEGREVWLEQSISLEKATGFDDVLDDLLEQWITMHAKGGGVVK